MTSSDQIPAIQTFQFESNAVGSAASSVNLFRGDVNLTVPLFAMPGRGNNPDLAVRVSLLYQSNVTLDAATWNLDAPTGTVGLGWTLDTSAIVLTDQGSPTPGAWSYAYASGGTSTPLIREPSTPFLFSLPGTLTSALVDKQPVPAAVVAGFAAHGLPLDPAAVLGAPAAGATAWTVTDSTNQRLYQLSPNAAQQTLDACDGGQSFQLESFRFWKILYYPVFERWVIVDDAGSVQSFGGLGAAIGRYQTAVGNSIEWGVRWADSGGKALWSGASSQTTGQVQYARVWNLATVSNPWGDSVAYGYNEWARVGGLIPEVEQLVGGAGGLPYTKACYLTSVTDVFGRKASFVYAGKLWDDSAPGNPREYADPHKATPDNSPNAYQDCYETKYLSAIAVTDQGGAAMFTMNLTYAPRPQVPGPAGAVANVTANTGTLLGDTYKRFLTAITMVNADGDSLPGHSFGYCLDAGAAGASPGALQSTTDPSGAVTTYQYTQQQIAFCDRTQLVTQPPGAQWSGASPRVWFGPDYAVVTWCQPTAGLLSLTVYSWVGNWQGWQLSGDPVLLSDSTGLDLNSLDVITQETYFALRVDDAAACKIFLFGRDVARPSQWVPATVGSTVTGKNSPTQTYTLGNAPTLYAGGSTFFLTAAQNWSAGTTSYQRFTWRWTTQSWTLEDFSAPAYSAITALNEYYTVLNLKTGVFNLYYLDPTLTWCTAPNAVTLKTPQDDTTIAQATGPSLVAVSELTSSTPTQQTYSLQIVQWNAAYHLSLAHSTVFNDPEQAQGVPGPWQPSVVGDDFVACAGNLVRFTGTGWVANSNLTAAVANAGITAPALHFAYGPDYAAAVVSDTAGVAAPVAFVLGFDPDADCAAWSDQAASPAAGLPVPAAMADLASFPTGGSADYLTLGNLLYYRGTATDWTKVVSGATPTDLVALYQKAAGKPDADVLLSAALVDEAPEFLAFSVYDSTTSTSTAVAAVLRNGQVQGLPVLFPQQVLGPTVSGVTLTDGALPGGPGTFVTYPAGSGGDFTKATSFTLYRYAGAGVSGPLTHYAVTAVSVDDGMQDSILTTYAADPTTTACDPTGRVFKYYSVTSYPGSGGGASSPFGSVVSTFVNGVQSAIPYYTMLDGMPAGVVTRDAAQTVLSTVSYGYEVVTQRTIDTPAGQSVAWLNGGLVLQTQETRTQDGVSATLTTGYVPAGLSAPYTGQPAVLSKTVYGGGGTQETFTAATSYAAEVDAVSRALHMLRPVAQTVSSWTPQGGATVTTGIRATALAHWPSPAGGGVVVPAPECDFVWTGGGETTFPFASYQPGQTPAGWQAGHRVIGYTAQGVVQESADGNGVRHSILYGADSLPVATADNASLVEGQWAYAGFEPYETALPGVAVSGGTVVSGDAAAGTASLQLPADGGASLTLTATPALSGAGPYLLGYWVKTPAGWTPGAGAGWTVTVTADGKAQPAVTAPFPATGGVWSFATLPVPLPAAGSSLTVAAVAANAGAQAVQLDEVHLAPLGAALRLTSYDPDFRLTTAESDGAGRRTRTFYDRFQRPVARTDALERPRHVTDRFLSRQGSAAGAFLPASPNARIEVLPAGGGTWESFLTGAEWTSRWTAGTPSAWTLSPGALSHAAGAGDTLTWKGWTGTAPATAAFLVEMVPAGTLSGSVGVTFGGGYTIGYAAGSGYSFTKPGGGAVQSPLGAPPVMARRWLLVMGQGVVLFFGDGQLLFSAAAGASPAASLALSTGPNALTLRNLAVLALPRVGVAFSDAATRQRQVHQLFGVVGGTTSDAEVIATIPDALSRIVATTKSAPASFGQDSGLPLLAYRPNFVLAPAFLTATASSWLLTGDVADYYAGQSDGPVQRSNDQGYPYVGTRYQGTLGRPLERGLPGAALAIANVTTTTPAQRQTTQFAYAANAATGTLPAGEYFQSTVTSPVKSQFSGLTDTASRQVATSLLGSTGALAQTAGSVTYSNAGGSAGTALAMSLPNALDQGPQSGDAGYVSTLQQNTLGLLTARTGPSTGTVAYLYDGCGRTRFVQPPLGAGELGYQYVTYDALGRPLEEGVIPAAWDAAALAPLAMEPGWPTADVTRTVTRVYAYDGTGADPTQIGRTVSVVTTNPAPAALPSSGTVTVTESFAYDALGRLISVTQALSGAVTQSGTIGYAYNVQDEPVQVLYPEGSPLAMAVYSYDDLGRVVGIGSTAATPTDIAAYTYTIGGEIETETRNKGTLTGTYQYSSPGWLTAYTATASGAGAACLTIGYAYNGDASVAQRTVTTAFSGAAATTQTSYTYDPRRQLTVATVASGTGNESVGSYDPNGNIWSVTDDGGTTAFPLLPGSDRLSQVTPPSGGALACTYDARGNLLALGGERTLGMDFSLGFTVSAVAGGTAVRLAYGGGSQRVLKQVAGGSLIYFAGQSQSPLATVQGGVWTAFVAGPTGLVAAVADQVYCPLVDSSRTVLAVLDQNNAPTAQYAYLPFGKPLAGAVTGTDPIGRRFMGQPYDAEFGLYDFRARLYDPVLRRFCGPDPAGQYVSPYLFVGNDPLSMIDPSGTISVWAQIGVTAALIGVTVAGIVLTPVTAGASDGVAGGVDATLTGGAETGIEMTSMGGTSSVTAETSGAVAQQVARSAGTKVLQTALASAVQGAGISGLSYDASTFHNPRNFSFGQLGLAMLNGAVSGAVTGGLGAYTPALNTDNLWSSMLTRAAYKGAVGGVGGDVSALLTDAETGQKPTLQGLAGAFKHGFGSAAAIQFGSDFASNVAGDLALAGVRRLASSKDPILNRARQARISQTVTKGATLISKAKSAAKSDTAMSVYKVTGAVLVTAWLGYGYLHDGGKP